ncbi:helix-turn-helix domain-containing protein [Micromonospora sp. NBC_00898]|uniref:ArsR/SmtB family transcription factor n=1 Tax=Micromonospora sp. NBC_00898 TaxID=2975981 RepID=UPI00386D3E12|nr:helix-turn-helix domain-containing protein [Micromonospora sp. NBC_00898]
MSLRNPDHGPGGNPYGDLELTDPHAMRALSHPVRLAILSRLQRHGAATATELSEHVGASPSVTSWHLRHLARFGLVRDSDLGGDARKRYWEASARGIRFQFPDDEEGRAASQVLSRTMFAQHEDVPRRWLAHVEPGLEPEWRREAGMSNTGVGLTVAELAAVNAAIERVLAPYVTRDAADQPPGARYVRFVRYVLPEAAE